MIWFLLALALALAAWSLYWLCDTATDYGDYDEDIPND